MKKLQLTKTNNSIVVSNWNGRPTNVKRILYKDVQTGKMYMRHKGQAINVNFGAESNYDNVFKKKIKNKKEYITVP